MIEKLTTNENKSKKTENKNNQVESQTDSNTIENKNLKVCLNCNTQLSEEQEFCHKCGTKFGEVLTVATNNKTKSAAMDMSMVATIVGLGIAAVTLFIGTYGFGLSEQIKERGVNMLTTWLSFAITFIIGMAGLYLWLSSCSSCGRVLAKKPFSKTKKPCKFCKK